MQWRTLLPRTYRLDDGELAVTMPLAHTLPSGREIVIETDAKMAHGIVNFEGERYLVEIVETLDGNPHVWRLDATERSV